LGGCSHRLTIAEDSKEKGVNTLFSRLGTLYGVGGAAYNNLKKFSELDTVFAKM
jgi:hypothetical protein